MVDSNTGEYRNPSEIKVKRVAEDMHVAQLIDCAYRTVGADPQSKRSKKTKAHDFEASKR